MCRQFIHDLTVFFQELLRPLIAFMEQLHHLRVNVRRRHIGTGQRCPAVQILAFHRSKPHQSKLFTHAKAGNHISCNARRLFNVVGRTCSHRVEDNLLRRAPAQQAHKSVAKLRLGIQILFLLRHMHDISQRSHRARHNRDLLYRLGIFLQRTHKRMAHLMVGHNLTLFLAHHAVFLFLAYEHLLHRVKEIFLAHILPAKLHGIDGRLVDHIRKIGANRAGSSQRNLVQIHRIVHQNILGVHL